MSASNERKVPVLQTETNLIEQEFDSIREKFELEMGKMEDEMARFRSQLIASGKSKEKMFNNEYCDFVGNEQFAGERQQEGDDNRLEHRSLSRRTTKTTTTTTSRRVKSTTNAALEEGHQLMQQDLVSKQLAAAQRERDRDQRQEEEEGEGEAKSNRWLSELNSPLIKDDQVYGKILKLRFDVGLYEPEQILVKTVDNRLQIHAKREEKSQNMSMYREYNREFLLPDGVDVELIRSSLSSDGVLTVEAPLPAAGKPAATREQIKN